MAETVDITGITTSLYNLLKPLEPDDRRRVVRAAQTLLGEIDEHVTVNKTAKTSNFEESEQVYPAKVQAWMQRNGINTEMLSQIFHAEGDTNQIIANDVPGKSAKEKTINAYILTGTQSFITTGESKFDDKSARENCKTLGCFNDTNHATYIKDKGNVIGGTKDTGWSLTGPGLKVAADIVKTITS